MITITDKDLPISVPTEIALCPYCNTPLTRVEIMGCVLQADGSWLVDQISLECETTPDIDSDTWPAWYEAHSQMPYVYMMPVTKQVLAWMAEHYRVKEPDPFVSPSQL